MHLDSSLLHDSIAVVAFLCYVATHRPIHLCPLNIAAAVFALGHTLAYLGMFGLFQADLWYAHSSPIMDLRLKHSCSYIS